MKARALTNMKISDHPSFVDSKGRVDVSLIGGSRLYGLDTPDSDTDYRGVFTARSMVHISGFKNVESIVTCGEIDSTYYEVRHYLKLLQKSNTQVLEILYAPDDVILECSYVFNVIREHRERLFCTEKLKNSLIGYIHSETRLATGERSGQLGGKRKASVEKYGFSPKNFVQILRLAKVGQTLFNDGRYVVNLSDVDKEYHAMLRDIKIYPENWSKDKLLSLVTQETLTLNEALNKSKIKRIFDVDLASEIVYLAQHGK